LGQRRPRKKYASKCNNETVHDSSSIDGFARAPSRGGSYRGQQFCKRGVPRSSNSLR
jgi:hypothetical protein